MIRKLLLPALAALALAGCGDAPTNEAVPPEALPALWEVASADGEVEGWLFGTIHALPDGVSWRSDKLEDVAEQADLIVVEVANLDEPNAISDIFSTIAFDEPVPPLNERVDAHLVPSVRELVAGSSLSGAQFDRMESWAVALTLASASRVTDPANGVDKALLRQFDSGQVRELEGALRQLAIFDRLPNSLQRELLAASIEAAQTAERDAARLTRAWQSGDLAQLDALTSQGLLENVELRRALLTERNRRWMTELEAILAAPPRPLIAVGAAHMTGNDGLPALLEASGYTVRRIQ